MLRRVSTLRLADAQSAELKVRAPVRLKRDKRKTQIIVKSIRYFAEHGFDGGTRVLAGHLGISQSLLYHYFKSKDDLIESVYVYLFESRWDKRWEDMMRSSDLPAREKLKKFYIEYFRTVMKREWTRIFFFGALRNMDLHKRNFDIVRERIFPFIIGELRGNGKVQGEPLTPRELEVAWNLHATIFYLAIRVWILKLESPMAVEDSIAITIDLFLDGADRVLAADAPR